VGAGLAISGVVLQAMTRNMLAEPYLLGVTSGASTLAAASILFGFGTSGELRTLIGRAPTPITTTIAEIVKEI
jgi:iron complex transport system permease protein